MSHYVFSTLSNDNLYVNHRAADDAENDIREAISVRDHVGVEHAGVLIKGKANVIDGRLVTPRGVMTQVSDEQLSYLESNLHFGLHRKNGFVTVAKKPEDPEKIAADLIGRDTSAQLEPSDYEAAGEAPPKVDELPRPEAARNSRRA